MNTATFFYLVISGGCCRERVARPGLRRDSVRGSVGAMSVAVVTTGIVRDSRVGS